MQDIFVDRLGNVMISAGVARLEFARLRATEGDTKKLKLEPSICLAIPAEGLSQMIGMLEEMKAQLAAKASSAGTRRSAPEAKSRQ